ncbi:hypothetical protein Cpir12675_005190 [Ceratocystis pirilliformis]|uniref:Uncharacterized protein n=1 Tax=Ceratocystis pirilliformis TaxID=259994 RepID=A0ABR3YSJ4_9PEZI
MLGRLGMTVDQSIRAYKKFAQTAFTTRRPKFFQKPWPTTFSDINLENAIKQVIHDSCTKAPCVELRQLDSSVYTTCAHEDLLFYDRSCTETAVLALTSVNVEIVPTLLRAYDRSDEFTGCKIWEVAGATSAAASFFSPIQIGRCSVKFIDANFDYNNSCEILIREAKKKSSPGQPMIITSIGTGLGNVVGIRDTTSSVIEALKAMASTSKQATLRLKNEYRNIGGYYRFDVDDGLRDTTVSDWGGMSRISAHTKNYLCKNEHAIREFVQAFTVALL